MTDKITQQPTIIKPTVKVKKRKMSFGILTILLIITLASVTTSIFLYIQYTKTQKLLQNPNFAAKQEVDKYTAMVSKLMELPENEEPTVATVLDKEKLKDQPFFAKSENGDKVIIYTKAAKAILFRPSANKIVEVAPINIAQPPLPTVKETPSNNQDNQEARDETTTNVDESQSNQ